MNFLDYAAIDAINWSTLEAMRKSPLHYRHLLANPRRDTKALKLGRIAHKATFEPDTFADEYVVEPDFGDLRFKDNKAARADWLSLNADRESVSVADYTSAIAIRDAVRNHPDASAYLADGEAEVTVTWTDPATKLACKGRLDFVSRSKPAILNLKTSRDILLERFSRQVLRYGWHTQEAFYHDGWLLARGQDLPCVLIAVESAAPHDVGVFRIDDDTMALGDEERAGLLEKVRQCRAMQRWEGMYPMEMTLRLPPWAFGDDDDLESLGLED